MYSGGTENVAVTAGETKNAAKTYPSIIRNVFWRILLFYLVSIVIIGLDVPYTYPNLSTKTSATSPFTIVFQEAGSVVAGSFINAVIMTSAISAANHALYAGSRLMHTLAIKSGLGYRIWSESLIRSPGHVYASHPFASVLAFAVGAWNIFFPSKTSRIPWARPSQSFGTSFSFSFKAGHHSAPSLTQSNLFPTISNLQL